MTNEAIKVLLKDIYSKFGLEENGGVTLVSAWVKPRDTASLRKLIRGFLRFLSDNVPEETMQELLGGPDIFSKPDLFSPLGERKVLVVASEYHNNKNTPAKLYFDFSRLISAYQVNTLKYILRDPDRVEVVYKETTSCWQSFTPILEKDTQARSNRHCAILMVRIKGDLPRPSHQKFINNIARHLVSKHPAKCYSEVLGEDLTGCFNPVNTAHSAVTGEQQQILGTFRHPYPYIDGKIYLSTQSLQLKYAPTKSTTEVLDCFNIFKTSLACMAQGLIDLQRKTQILQDFWSVHGKDANKKIATLLIEKIAENPMAYTIGTENELFQPIVEAVLQGE